MTRTKTRALANWPNNAVSVLDYGADPNGSVNCTAAFQAAIDSGKAVYIPAGRFIIDNVQFKSNTKIVGAGPGSTTLLLGGGASNGLHYTGVSVGECSFHLADFAIEGNSTQESGLLIKGAAHGYVENVHVVRCIKGIHLQNSLLNTFIRCRVHQNVDGVYIDGTDPWGGSSHTGSKNSIIDLKATNNGTAANDGAGLRITGVSAYQNTIINADFEGNWLATWVDSGLEGANVYISPYFEAFGANGSDTQNLTRVKEGVRVKMYSPIFGSTNPSNNYFDFNHNGTYDLVDAASNSAGVRIIPPKSGRLELTLNDGSDILSDRIQTNILNDTVFTPTHQTNSNTGKATINSYCFGSCPRGVTNLSTSTYGPNDWAGGAVISVEDPLGNTNAAQVTSGTVQVQSVGTGVNTGNLCLQVFVRSILDGASEFFLEYWNNFAVVERRIFAFNGTTDWMLIHLPYTLKDGQTDNHGLAINQGVGKVEMWHPQIIHGTLDPVPPLPAHPFTTTQPVLFTSYLNT